MEETPWVVLKFGGSSVATAQRWKEIVQIVHKRAQHNRVLVVCSALTGVSDMLESLPHATLGGQHKAILEAIKVQHHALASALGVDVRERLDSLCGDLDRLCLGASLVGEFGPKLRARVMSAGELLATRIGAGFLHHMGLDCEWLDARSCLTSQGAQGDPWRHYLSASVADGPDPELQARLNTGGHRVVMTQGFVARDPEGHTVLLGRGGSDVSAALFSAALQAERCEIFSDVPGMYTANPRQVPSARLLKQLDYDEAQELASMGAKVLHPRALAPLRKAGIPLHLGATQAPSVEGTRILPVSTLRGRVKAVSAKRGITLVRMDTIGMWQQVGFLADAFSIFKARGLSIDLVSTSETNITVSLDPSANVLDAEVLEDPGSGIVATLVVGQAEEAIGIYGVVAFFLECVGSDLVGETDAAALLAKVDDGPHLAATDHVEGEVQLLTAVALQRTEHLGGKALIVDANGHIREPLQVATENGNRLAAIAQITISANTELPPLGGQQGLGDKLHASVQLTVGRGHRHTFHSGGILSPTNYVGRG